MKPYFSNYHHQRGGGGGGGGGGGQAAVEAVVAEAAKVGRSTHLVVPVRVHASPRATVMIRFAFPNMLLGVVKFGDRSRDSRHACTHEALGHSRAHIAFDPTPQPLAARADAR